ncbi:MAG TPA: type II toxin-antitoxin system PemK/MazF family toxin [Candidatus Hydrogenedentes bacterium]|nr:type II toxin-antitoxin system PemK/MazF family toxin [Candidatus Hydrogenedentota bacterium]HQH52591.1 type II toxin-antitoxin system PemK/MazF family toxin [Candidatus Hydrogenedentota bacterium]
MSDRGIPPNPQRGELWLVNFEPQRGQEVKKRRPALVVGEPMLGNLSLRIVVPVFTDRGRHIKLPWFVRIPKSARSGQDRDGEIDASQVKSVSVNRFDKKIGDVTPGQIVGVVDAIALCLGYELPGGPGYS